MAEVIVGLATSLDGFIAGANDSPEQPLGEGESAHALVAIRYSHDRNGGASLEPAAFAPGAGVPVGFEEQLGPVWIFRRNDGQPARLAKRVWRQALQ